MSPLTLTIIAAVYALVLWIFLFFAWHRGYKEWKNNRDNRDFVVKARVMDKRELKNTSSDESVPWDQLITFEYSGTQKEYKVPADIFSIAKVGQTGMLHINKQQVVSYDPEKGTDNSDDLYRRLVRG